MWELIYLYLDKVAIHVLSCKKRIKMRINKYHSIIVYGKSPWKFGVIQIKINVQIKIISIIYFDCFFLDQFVVESNSDLISLEYPSHEKSPSAWDAGFHQGGALGWHGHRAPQQTPTTPSQETAKLCQHN